jgi:phosphate starvation-inducible PhoH-like protein
MFLTRIGFGSKVIITGDLTQKDLPVGQKSGLEHSVRILKSIDDIGFSYLTSQDVVRHPLVQKIVKAYDDFESKHTEGGSRRGISGRSKDDSGVKASEQKKRKVRQ